METKAFAFFDFDGTLCKGDSIMPFLLYAVKHGIAPKRQIWSALCGYLRQKLDASKVVQAKEATLSFIRGRPMQEMDAFASRFIQDMLVPDFFVEGLSALQELRKQGVYIVIVSASPDVYMRMLPSFLPIDAVIATPCEIGPDGSYTGHITCNCKGDMKPKLIEQWLQKQGWSIDQAASSAYGDSLSDAPMLRMTGRPVMVNPKAKLKQAMPNAELVSWHPKDKE